VFSETVFLTCVKTLGAKISVGKGERKAKPNEYLGWGTSGRPETATDKAPAKR